MELHDAKEAMKMRKILVYDIRMKKSRQNKGDAFWIFMDLCGSKVHLASPQGNFINGVTNPEMVYMVYFFIYFALTEIFFKKNAYFDRKFIKFQWNLQSNHLKVLKNGCSE